MNASSSENNSASKTQANTSASLPEVRPNWYWLQSRVLAGPATRTLSDWISAELEELESAFQDLSTTESLKASNKMGRN